MLKRLEGADSELFQRIVGDVNTIVLVDGTPYLVARLPLANEVELEIETDPNLKASIDRPKNDIEARRVYSTEDAVKMLEKKPSQFLLLDEPPFPLPKIDYANGPAMHIIKKLRHQLEALRKSLQT